MKNLKVKGFTLAETLITLTILGVVAAITVPMLINKQMEAANRTKLKKAMAAYEKALNQMIIDNDVKGDIGDALNTAGCTITSPYFKPIKTATGNNCRFQTADKVWWDITDIEHPLISLKDEITDENIATLKGNADSLDDDKASFVMVGEIKDGIVRINDKAGVVKDSDNEKYLDKLYAFMNKDGSTSTPEGDGETQIQSDFMKNCELNSEGSQCTINKNNKTILYTKTPLDGENYIFVNIQESDDTKIFEYSEAQNLCEQAGGSIPTLNDIVLSGLINTDLNCIWTTENSGTPYCMGSDNEPYDTFHGSVVCVGK